MSKLRSKKRSDEWKYAFAALFTVCIVICLFSAYKGNQSQPAPTINNTQAKNNYVNTQSVTTNKEITDSSSLSKGTTVYEDDYIKVDYKNLVQYDYVELMFYLDLQITNNTSSLINIHIGNLVVNAMETPSDLFGYISDLDSQHSIIKRIGISFGAADIQSINEIDKIKFTAEITDAETHKLIFKTDYINIEF